MKRRPETGDPDRQRRGVLARLARRFTVIVTATAVVALVLGLFTNAFGRQLIPGLPLLRLQHVERFATSSITLEEVRELYAFNTVRYVHRAVFPYDYLMPDVSMNELLRRLRDSPGTPREILTAEEYLHFRAMSLAAEINLSQTGGTYDFVVANVTITAGYEVEHADERILIERLERSAGAESANDGAGNAASGTARRATITLADPVITRVAVEDIDPDDYPYPDISIGADGWRRIAEFVREQALSEEIVDELLATARENGRAFVERTLRQAGFAEIEFTTGPDAETRRTRSR